MGLILSKIRRISIVMLGFSRPIIKGIMVIIVFRNRYIWIRNMIIKIYVRFKIHSRFKIMMNISVK